MNEERLAVLIDADNIPYSNISGMLDEIAKHGTPTIKRIYGDWTKPTVSGWKPALLEHAITPVQQYSYTTGKNATDSAMIIDAMDILHGNKVDGFCLVSSDSDFTRLATRIRESGMQVIGIGEKKTPHPFIAACNKFIYIEILNKEKQSSTKSRNKSKQKSRSSALNKIDSKLIQLITDSVDELSDESGWTFLGSLGNYILKKKPDFDPRNYGFTKLLSLIESTNKFDVDERESGVKNVRHIYIRNK